MRTLKLYRHGFTMASIGYQSRRGGPRGKVTGWSPGAARRNTAFLRSVDETTLTGHGIALTLTMKDCPESGTDLATILTSWIKRQRRGSMVRLHWVMEFQKRGVPHYHVAIWYDGSPQDALRRAPVESDYAAASFAISNIDMHKAEPRLSDYAVKAVADWIELTAHLGTGPKGQHARPIIGAVGWFQYLAKHCGRGRQHYQRQQANTPKAWGSSPRVWGKSGDWKIIEPATAVLTTKQWYKLRRLVRAQRVARSRSVVPGPGWSWLPPLFTKTMARDFTTMPGLPSKLTIRHRLRLLKHARSMLRCTEQKLSQVRGVSEWITEDQQQQLLRAIT